MLEIDNLTVRLDGHLVLDSITATVAPGSWACLVGPNGAGKTTLLRAVAGLTDHDGDVRVAGHRLPQHDPRRIARFVAYVPQRPVLPALMTVTDYVMLGRSAHRRLIGRESDRDRRVVTAVLDQLQLTPLARRRMGQLSGGQAQRAVLARSLAQEAPLLALDEPTSSLDLGHSQLVLDTIDQLRRDHGLTVLSAVHDLTLAAKYADRLLMLTPSRSIIDGRPDHILDAETVLATFCATVEVLPRPDGPVVAPVRLPTPQRGSHDTDPTH